MSSELLPGEERTVSDHPSLAASILERAPLPIVEIRGPAHRVTHANPAVCILLGKLREDLIGKSFFDAVPGGRECLVHIEQVYQTGETAIHVREIRGGTRPIYWLYAIWPALDAQDRPVGIIIHLSKTANFRADATAVNEALLIAGLRQHELTEVAKKVSERLREEAADRVRAEAALRESVSSLEAARQVADRASHAKDEFLAALSHELRTPLTPVLMAAAALREDDRLPAEAREQLAMIERNIALEARLIDDLLDLTKIAHGKLHLRSQQCNAHHLIEYAIAIVEPEARANGINIEHEFAARQCSLFADPTRFQQVIWNLLRNAVKFTPFGGKISIRTRDAMNLTGEPRLRIEITDSGLGIEPARLEQIFKPFDQGGHEGDRRFGGVGLGLAIARAVVDAHHGKISAQSEGANHGTTFVIEMPGATRPSTSELATQVPPPSPTLSKPPFHSLRLLLVEDHENTLQTLARLLRSDGHTVTACGNIAAALAAAAAAKFDVVISDLGLPDGTGNELMTELRNRYGLRGIALSGYGAEQDVARSIAAGFVVHLVKPVRVTELRRVIGLLFSSIT